VNARSAGGSLNGAFSESARPLTIWVSYQTLMLLMAEEVDICAELRPLFELTNYDGPWIERSDVGEALLLRSQDRVTGEVRDCAVSFFVDPAEAQGSLLLQGERRMREPDNVNRRAAARQRGAAAAW